MKTIIKLLVAIKNDIKKPKLKAGEFNTEKFSKLKFLGSEEEKNIPILSLSLHDKKMKGSRMPLGCDSHFFAWNESFNRDYPEVKVDDVIGVKAKDKI